MFEGLDYDATLGFPGEGWGQFTTATWNTRSLTHERYEYCKSLGYDILAITELWRNQHKYQKSTNEFIVSEAALNQKGPRKDKIRYPKDSAAGVGIILSPHMQKKVHSFGSNGERVCWVRLKGPVCNLFVVAVYLPYRGRVAPTQDQTLTDLQNALNGAHPRDCICLLGDLNEQLGAGVKNVTDRFTGGPPPKNAAKIVDMLRLNDLAAVNTYYQPKPNKSVHTYLHTKRNDNAGDSGMYVGRKVKEQYRGRLVAGEVIATQWTQDIPTWIVKFEDGYVAKYGEKQLRKKLTHVETEKEGHQIDYICVSRRWMSCVQSSEVRWAPSMHRDLHGEKNDHGLVASKWKWRIRSPKAKTSKDFSVRPDEKNVRRGRKPD